MTHVRWLLLAAFVVGFGAPASATPASSSDAAVMTANSALAAGLPSAQMQLDPDSLSEAPLGAESGETIDGLDNLPLTATDDLTRWLKEKHSNHRLAMAEEARLLYRRGLIAEQTGKRDEAIRLVRGAADLDPAFLEPHWTLASWFLFRDPGQAIHQFAALFEVARHSFVVQLDLLGNALFMVLQGLIIGILATAFFIVLLRSAEIRHAIQEHLAQHLTRPSAAFWAWFCFIAPFLVGAGLVLPTAAFLAFLWPASKTRERVVFVVLVTAFFVAPFAITRITVMEAPMDREQAPFFGVHMMQSEAFSEKRSNELTRLAKEHPDNPFVQFGLGWSARQGSDPASAEAAYRHAASHWPDNDRVVNNLGNAVALQGRFDEAIEIYQRAIRINPDNAAAYYNMAQAHTQRFEFRASNEALSRASALDFDLVRRHQAEITESGVMPRVDQWLAPGSFWSALLQVSDDATNILPPVWRGAIESSTRAFPITLALVVIAGLGAGFLQKRVLPMRRCSNCDRVVCRRCAERRRQVALCRPCAKAEAAAQSVEFSHTLLVQQRRKVQGKLSIVRTTLAALVPGFGMLIYKRVFLAFLFFGLTGILATMALGLGKPFIYQPSPQVPDLNVALFRTIAPWVMLYLASLAAYFQSRIRFRAQRAKEEPLTQRRRTRSALREAA